MLPNAAARALLALPGERAIELLSPLAAPPAVSILRHVEEPRRSELIAGLPTASALAATLLLGYIDDSVGSCVDPDVIALPAGLGARDALERVRHADTRADRVFVVGEDRRLLGWIPIDTLLRAADTAQLASLLQEVPARLAAHASLAGARAHPGWRSSSTLPVLDRKGHLIGVLTRDALERASQKEPSAARDADSRHSLTGLLAEGYWNSVSGVLELLSGCLPRTRPIGRSSDAR
jgi:magnesium transporter